MFGGKDKKEEKEQAKLNEIMKKYGLEDVSPEYMDAVKEINTKLAGTGMMELGNLLSGKSEDNLKILYLNALMKQNWIIIRELDDISKKLDK